MDKFSRGFDFAKNQFGLFSRRFIFASKGFTIFVSFHLGTENKETPFSRNSQVKLFKVKLP